MRVNEVATLHSLKISPHFYFLYAVQLKKIKKVVSAAAYGQAT
jgi:hypothetical protein